MSKQGVSKISGNPTPKVGEETLYKVTEWYPATPSVKRNPALVTWELFKKRSNGKFTSTNIRKKGNGVFTFGQVASKHTYRLEAYLHSPEGKGPTTIEIRPQESTIPKINKVELFYADDSKGTVFSYTEKLVAKAQTVNLTGEKLLFTLWEDDAKGQGHNPANLFVDSKTVAVGKNGLANAEFVLTKALMQKAMKGETDAKELEFYVTVEYYKNKKHATKNVDVKNPDYKVPKKPAQAPVKAKDSPAAQKPQSKKEEKGIVDEVVDWFSELWDWGESKGTVKAEQKPAPKKKEGKTETIVKSEKAKDPKECFCKLDENQFYWSSKLTCEQRKKVLQVCSELWGEEQKKQKASELMSVMHLETAATFDPSKDNGSGYSGLIQFSDASARSVGTTRRELKRMTFVEQMDYVKKYFERKKDLLNTMTDLYLLVLKQNAVGQGSNGNYILFDEGVSVPNAPYDVDNLSREPWVTKYGYSSNPSFMRENGEYANRRQFRSYSRGVISRKGFENGKTYVWEVTDVLTREHYNLGESEIFRGICENKPEERRDSDGKYPPWVDIAIAEEAKAIRESTHCQYIIDTYHASTDNAKMRRCGSENDSNRANSAWCGAFVAYCLKASGHKYQPDPGAIWHGKENLVKRNNGAPYETSEKWGKKYNEMYIGGIVEWHNNGHTTIIVGIDKSNSNNYILLGGNQDNGVRFWTAPKRKVHPYCIFPADYEGDLLPLENIEPSDLSPNAVKYQEGAT
ncbi:hypothetical protein, partial [Chryseobacterium sp.]|uniref:hypothetical protein n=1 Tax=Chryseobacterium sp. TaxID=1871047 RepID=UPI0025C2AA5C